MVNFRAFHKDFVAAILLIVAFLQPAPAQEAGEGTGIDDLLALLATPDLQNWEEVEGKIRVEWSRSGSASMDLLLSRAQTALEAGDIVAAIEHATALTDHAPDFAEGWNILGASYYQANLYGPALDAIERTLQLNPRHFAALRGLALILEELGDRDRALFAYRAAADIHPHMDGVAEAIERLSVAADGQKI